MISILFIIIELLICFFVPLSYKLEFLIFPKKYAHFSVCAQQSERQALLSSVILSNITIDVNNNFLKIFSMV